MGVVSAVEAAVRAGCRGLGAEATFCVDFRACPQNASAFGHDEGPPGLSFAPGEARPSLSFLSILSLPTTFPALSSPPGSCRPLEIEMLGLRDEAARVCLVEESVPMWIVVGDDGDDD